MLLIVMYQTGTWQVRPGDRLTFGREPTSTVVLAADDLGVSRRAGSLACENGIWWLSNDSSSSMLYLSADLGFRVDLPPGTRAPVEQWHAKVRVTGMIASYTLRLRLPHLDGDGDGDDDDSDANGDAEGADRAPAGAASLAGAASPAGVTTARAGDRGSVTNPRARTSTRNRAPLTESDRLVLAARFEEYLDWRHVGDPSPRSARQAADRIGWDPHKVTKRCENIRNRYARHGVAELRGPRALEELVALLISTGELTSDDLRRLPSPPTRIAPTRTS